MTRVIDLRHEKGARQASKKRYSVCMQHERERNLVVRVDDEELAMAHALADAGDEPIARVVRRMIRHEYADKFGTAKPPKPKLKHAAK